MVLARVPLQREKIQRDSERIAANTTGRDSERIAANTTKGDSERIAANTTKGDSERIAANTTKGDSERIVPAQLNDDGTFKADVFETHSCSASLLLAVNSPEALVFEIWVWVFRAAPGFWLRGFSASRRLSLSLRDSFSARTCRWSSLKTLQILRAVSRDIAANTALS